MLLRTSFHGSARPAPRDFPLALDLHYRVLGENGSGARGTGRTLWISSRSIIFEASDELRAGTDLEITIAWPACLDENVGLQLCLRAHVLRPLSAGVTAEIRKYQFRTRKLARTVAA